MKKFTWKRASAIPTNPFELSKSQVQQLADLTTRPGYAILLKLLQDVAEHNGDILLKLKDHSEIRERQGFINALRYVVDIVPNIQQRADVVNAERARLESDATDGNGYNWTGFGGPWRDVYDRLRRSADPDRDTA